jgi:putative ABC transport system ATP-binding protein
MVMTYDTTQSPLELDGISQVFVTEELETHALSNVRLDIHQGEFISMAGPSGCGKSTLLSILGLLDSPTHGETANDCSLTADCASIERGFT